MKKLLIFIPIFFLVALSSCLKDKPNTDFSGISPVVEITTSSNNPTLNAPSAGLAFFPKATLSFSSASDPDTISFTVNYASDYPPTKDVAVTVAVDQAALAAYNADSVHNSPYVNFELFPDSTYSFPVTTGVIHAGQRLDTFYVIFHPSVIDPTHSYMLPISVKSATGATISGNLSTIYFHAIGNPIAGNYTQEWIRYNTATQTGTPAYDEVFEGSFLPNNPTEIVAESGTGVNYILDFTNTNGVLSNFQVSFPASGSGSASNAGITITSGPTIIMADPINHKYEFNFTYLNGSGSPRNITDIFTP